MPARKDLIKKNREHKEEPYSFLYYFMLRKGLKPYNMKVKNGFLPNDDKSSLLSSHRDIPFAVHSWGAIKYKRVKDRIFKAYEWSKQNQV